MSDLLPATNGLFLGNDSRRWDGSKLINLPPFNYGVCVNLGLFDSVPYTVDVEAGQGHVSYQAPRCIVITEVHGIGIWFESQRTYRFPRIRFNQDLIQKFKFKVQPSVGYTGYQIWANNGGGELFNTGWVENPPIGDVEITINKPLLLGDDFELKVYVYVENTEAMQYGELVFEKLRFEIQKVS